MNREWNDSQPIYRQLRDRVVAYDSRRRAQRRRSAAVGAQCRGRIRVNPLTVLKAYQELVDEQLVEKRRGLGMFVNAGAREPLLKAERRSFSPKNGQGCRHHSAARSETGRNCSRRRSPQFEYQKGRER